MKYRAKTYPYLFFVMVFFVQLLNAQSMHFGRWSGPDDKQQVGTITLNQDGSASFAMSVNVFGGPDFKYKGRPATIQYEIRYDKDPIWLDFVIIDSNSGNEMSRLKGIVHFIDAKTMQLRLNFDPAGDRYRSFDKANDFNTILLQKSD
jgi:hypothetical protein